MAIRLPKNLLFRNMTKRKIPRSRQITQLKVLSARVQQIVTLNRKESIPLGYYKDIAKIDNSTNVYGSPLFQWYLIIEKGVFAHKKDMDDMFERKCLFDSFLRTIHIFSLIKNDCTQI